jgi:hypothetical protein
MQHITLIAEAHAGKVTVSADVPVPSETGTYVVTIAVTPKSEGQPAADAQRALDDLYGALADAPMPEIMG